MVGVINQIKYIFMVLLTFVENKKCVNLFYKFQYTYIQYFLVLISQKKKFPITLFLGLLRGGNLTVFY